MDLKSLYSKLEDYSDKLYNKHNNLEDYNTINKFLMENIKIDNLYIFKELLQNSANITTRFYAANSLIKIITDNYLSVSLENFSDLYVYLISLIVLYFLNKYNYSEELFTRERPLLNKLISLLCVLTRLNWFNIGNFREICKEIETLFNDNSENCYKELIIFMIYSELINCFQDPNLPPKNK